MRTLTCLGLVVIACIVACGGGGGQRGQDAGASNPYDPSKDLGGRETVDGRQEGPTPSPIVPSGEAVTARQLSGSYETNEVAADGYYKGRMLKISGRVERIGKDILDQRYILLRGSDELHGVQCVFPDSADRQLAEVRPGTEAVIVGTCRGLALLNVVVFDCRLVTADVAAEAQRAKAEAARKAEEARQAEAKAREEAAVKARAEAQERARARAPERFAESLVLLEAAQKAFDGGDFAQAGKGAKEAAAGFAEVAAVAAGTPEGIEADRRLDGCKQLEKRVQSEIDAARQLKLAMRFEESGMRDSARQRYRKIIAEHAKTRAAAEAAKLLQP